MDDVVLSTGVIKTPMQDKPENIKVRSKPLYEQIILQTKTKDL